MPLTEDPTVYHYKHYLNKYICQYIDNLGKHRSTGIDITAGGRERAVIFFSTDYVKIFELIT